MDVCRWLPGARALGNALHGRTGSAGAVAVPTWRVAAFVALACCLVVAGGPVLDDVNGTGSDVSVAAGELTKSQATVALSAEDETRAAAFAITAKVSAWSRV